HFVGKKLVVVGDNKNPSIIMSQQLKELLGDDPVVVNPKYQALYPALMECRLIIFSNYPPNISSEVHNQSRTLWIKLSRLTVPPDSTWDSYYPAEMPGFLAYAQKCYQERCQGNSKVIEVNDAVKAAVVNRVAEFESKFTIL